MTKIKPYLDKVLVKPLPAPVNKSNIVLPSTSTTLQLAEIIAVSDGWLNDAGHKVTLDFKPGDIVYIPNPVNSSHKIKVGTSETYELIRFTDIYAQKLED